MKNSIPKNRILLRGAALALALCLLFSCASCGKKNTATALRADLSGRVYTLDPQYCSTALERCLLKNCMEGLLRRLPDGTMAEGCAENYSVSADGLRYTFTLRENLQWSDGEPLTAKDFVFAFRRLFRAETNSPYTVEFAALENSAAVLAGQMPESALGVTASGPLTLVFHLSSADDNFLEKLTLPGAMPCDEEFFNSTRGTYGLNASSTLSSGSFYIYNWTASGLFLRRAPSGSLIDSLRLVQNTNSAGQSAAELIANEKCSAAPDDTAAPTTLTSLSYSDTTWSLLFNCSSVFASTELRQALASAARGAAEVPDGGLYAAANGLVPDGLTVDGMNYRDTAGDVTPAAVDARALYLTARQTLTTSDFNKVSLMVPAGSGVTSAAEEINGVWQKEFSLFFSVEEVDEETFAKRLAEGDYTIALAPISAEGGSVYNMLNQFTAAGGSLTGYADSLYATQLQASTQATGSSRCRLLGDCERQLLSNAVAVPLFAQQKRLLIAPGIQNLIFDPFGPVLDLTYTTKE